MFLGSALLLLMTLQGPPTQSANDTVFGSGVTFDTFVASVERQKDRWSRPGQADDLPTQFVERLRRVAAGLRILIVAEDWCADSVNTVPSVARLAAAAGVELRIVSRASGAKLLDKHRTKDGRTATPLVVLLRNGQDAGAWVERPIPLQEAFERMSISADAAALAANRQGWYDRDRGRTALAEIVALAERTGQ